MPRCESPEYPYGDLAIVATRAYKRGVRVTVEVPSHDSILKSEQYSAMARSSDVKSVAFDGCCFGHRVAMSSQVAYVKSRWRMLAWGVDLSMLSKTCDGKHTHAKDGMHGEDGGDMKRTSKVARKLLRSLVGDMVEEAIVTTCPLQGGSIDRVMIEFCCGQDSNLGNYYDSETFWWKIEQCQTTNERSTVPGKAFYCEQCRSHLLDSESLRNAQFGPYCPGCAFKEQWRQYTEIVSWDDWKRLEQNCAACAVYLYKTYFVDEGTDEVICEPANNIKNFIRHCASTSRSNLAKTVSSLGALRVPVNMAVEYCQQGRARHLGWGRALSEDGNVCYIAYYDPGNAAYAGFMNCLFTGG